MKPSKKRKTTHTDEKTCVQSNMEDSFSKKTEVSVTFSSPDIAEKYQKQIEEFLGQVLVDDDKFCCSTLLGSADDKKKNSMEEQQRMMRMNGSGSPQVPLYDSTFDDTLEYCDEKEKSYMDPESETQKMTCFNCLGDHHLNDCPKEHDGSRIATNKRVVMESNQTIRYHTDDAQPLEKNGTFCPGRISINLRNALDLKPNQLPLYIYHMRVLGYPPGWMKEAEVEHSGLSVYDCDGNAMEEENNKDDSKRFNGENFIEFPGFNTPIPEGYLDEWKQLHMLPMQPHQQLSEALKHACVTVSPNLKKKTSSDSDDTSQKKKDETEEKEPPKIVSEKPKVDNDVSIEEKKHSSIIPGSPLIDTGNPCKRLPDCSKFSADITEHIPYENLPDAVGAYDRKMRGVLDQVRQDMNRLQEKSLKE